MQYSCNINAINIHGALVTHHVLHVVRVKESKKGQAYQHLPNTGSEIANRVGLIQIVTVVEEIVAVLAWTNTDRGNDRCAID